MLSKFHSHSKIPKREIRFSYRPTNDSFCNSKRLQHEFPKKLLRSAGLYGTTPRTSCQPLLSMTITSLVIIVHPLLMWTDASSGREWFRIVDAKRATLRDERANNGNAIYSPDGHKRTAGPYWHGGEREDRVRWNSVEPYGHVVNLIRNRVCGDVSRFELIDEIFLWEYHGSGWFSDQPTGV